MPTSSSQSQCLQCGKLVCLDAPIGTLPTSPVTLPAASLCLSSAQTGTDITPTVCTPFCQGSRVCHSSGSKDDSAEHFLNHRHRHLCHPRLSQGHLSSASSASALPPALWPHLCLSIFLSCVLCGTRAWPAV